MHFRYQTLASPPFYALLMKCNRLAAPLSNQCLVSITNYWAHCFTAPNNGSRIIDRKAI